MESDGEIILYSMHLPESSAAGVVRVALVDLREGRMRAQSLATSRLLLPPL
jgi:hypothetical protein